MPTAPAYAASASFFFRFELLDLVHLPSSVKFTEIHVLQYLSKFAREHWANAHRDIEFKPLHIGSGSSAHRSSLTLYFSLREWLSHTDSFGGSAGSSAGSGGPASSGSKVLHLGSTQKRAMWFRFATELYALQTAGFIRESVKIYEPNRPTLNRKSFELALIEFRVFAVLLWLQAFRHSRLSTAAFPASRTAAINAANAESSPRGNLQMFQQPQPNQGVPANSPSNRALERRAAATPASAPASMSLSPRQQHQRRHDVLFLPSSRTEGLQHEEIVALVKDAFLQSIEVSNHEAFCDLTYLSIRLYSSLSVSILKRLFLNCIKLAVATHLLLFQHQHRSSLLQVTHQLKRTRPMKLQVPRNEQKTLPCRGTILSI